MCDLIDHHARNMMLDLTGERRGVPQIGGGAPAEAAEGGVACQVHAGAGTARGTALGRAAEAAQRPPREPWRLDNALHDLTGGAMSVRRALDAVYGAAAREMAAVGPMPLASAEPWTEGDEAYAERMGYLGPFGTYFDGVKRIDYFGEEVGLPRARLVLAAPRVVEETRP